MTYFGDLTVFIPFLDKKALLFLKLKKGGFYGWKMPMIYESKQQNKDFTYAEA